MKVLCIDASTSTGWSLMEGTGQSDVTVLNEGLVKNEKPIVAYGDYPWNYMLAAKSIVDRLIGLVEQFSPDAVVVEEINLGSSRYAQRALEWIHSQFIQRFYDRYVAGAPEKMVPLYYISSSEWRKAIDLRLDGEQRRNNARLKKAKDWAKANNEKISVAKKKFGVAGKITKKHLAVAYVNGRFGLGFLQKDNDRADAICLGSAFFAGAKQADGIL